MRQRIILFIVISLIFLGGVFLIYAERSGLISIFADVPNVPGTVIVESDIDLQKGLMDSKNLALGENGLELVDQNQAGSCQFDVGSPQVKEFFRFQSIKKDQNPGGEVSVKFASSLDGVSFSDFSPVFKLDPTPTVPDSIDLTQVLPENTRFVRVACQLSSQNAVFQGFSLNFEALNLPSALTGPLNFGLEPIKGQAPLNVDLSRSAGLNDCQWDFGDGQKQSAEQLSTNHQFSQPGIYTVSLSCGSQTGTRQVIVTDKPFSSARIATTQSSYSTDQKVSFSLINDGPASIELATSAPFTITNSQTDELVFSPISSQQLDNLAVGQTKAWTWDLTNDQGNQVKPGIYTITISFSVNGENYSLNRTTTITDPGSNLNNLGLTANPIQGQAPLTVNLNSELPAILDLGDGTIVKNQSSLSYTYDLPGTYSISARSAGSLTNQVVLVTAGLVTSDLPQVPILINGFLAGSSDQIDAGNLSGTTETLIATGFLDVTTNILIVVWVIATVLIFAFRPTAHK